MLVCCKIVGTHDGPAGRSVQACGCRLVNETILQNMGTLKLLMFC